MKILSSEAGTLSTPLNIPKQVTKYEKAQPALAADAPDPYVAWPRTSGSHGVNSSTEYFRFAVTSYIMNVHYDFFGGPGLQKPESNAPDAFSAENNAWCVVADCDIELPAEGRPINVALVYAKIDDAPGKLIHDDESPMTLQQNRFAAKQVQAPQAIFRVTERGEPWNFRSVPACTMMPTLVIRL